MDSRGEAAGLRTLRQHSGGGLVCRLQYVAMVEQQRRPTEFIEDAEFRALPGTSILMRLSMAVCVCTLGIFTFHLKCKF